MSRRVQAAVAAGLVALGGAAPGVSIAQEPDQQHEGTTLPDGGPGDSAQRPDFEPGGDTPLPYEVPDQPDFPSIVDTGKPPAEPDVDATGSPTAPPAAPEQDVEPVDQAPAAPKQVPAPPPTTTPKAPPTAAPPPPHVQPPAKRHEANRREEKRSSRERRAKRPHHPAPRPPTAPPERPTTPAPPAVHAAPPVQVQKPRLAPYAGSASAQPVRQVPIAQNARVHVVRAGESLWSIAEDLLGRDASPARVAQEVNRLWELNAARIGTGDPDLVMAGTTLRLG